MQNLRLNLVNINSLIICLIPFFALTGPFLPDLSIVIVDLLFLYICLKENKWGFFKNKFFKIFLIFYFYLVLISFFSDNIFHSLSSSIFYVRFGIFTLALYYVINEDKSFITKFSSYFLITMIFASVYGLSEYSIHYFSRETETFRMSLPFNDKQVLGGFLVRFLPLIFAFWLINKKKIYNLYIFIPIILIIYLCILLSGERLAIGLLIISSIFILFTLNISKRLLVILAVLFMTSFLSISYFNKDFRDRNILSTLNGFGLTNFESVEFSNTNSLQIFTPIYDSHIRGAFNMFTNNPIFGVGPNQFRNLCISPEYNINLMTCSTHPHNTYIQLLAETGIIGFLFVFVIFIIISYLIFKHSLFKLFSKNLIYTNYQILIMICFFITLWPIAPSHNFFNNWINILYYLPVGFFIASVSQVRNK